VASSRSSTRARGVRYGGTSSRILPKPTPRGEVVAEVADGGFALAGGASSKHDHQRRRAFPEGPREEATLVHKAPGLVRVSRPAAILSRPLFERYSIP
jgi:hypothetical protein